MQISKNLRLQKEAYIKRSSFISKGVAGCKIEAQCKSGVGADSILSLTIEAGKEARLARGGIREHEAFLNREKKGPAGTRRVSVSMADKQKEAGGRLQGD